MMLGMLLVWQAAPGTTDTGAGQTQEQRRYPEDEPDELWSERVPQPLPRNILCVHDQDWNANDHKRHCCCVHRPAFTAANRNDGKQELDQGQRGKSKCSSDGVPARACRDVRKGG